MPTSASSLFSAYASFAATAMLIRSMANELIPPPLRSSLHSLIRYLFAPLSSNLTIIIDENTSTGMTRNQVYDAAQLYLSTKINARTKCIRVCKTQRDKSLTVSIDKGEEIADSFDNVTLRWKFVFIERQDQNPRQNSRQSEKRSFYLTFNKKFKDKVLDSYLPHVLHRADEIRNDQRVLKLYNRHCPYGSDGSGGGRSWGSINLEHPATFETLAMDPSMKKAIIADLDRFVRRKEFYKKVGKAWKRGYLLYGPPGTGKSSLIAAMANYLKFDIYDLELTTIFSNADLRKVLLSTTNRSILVIEDIDCSMDMKDRQHAKSMGKQILSLDKYQQPDLPSNSKLTLSGLLNSIDGLWSNCGDERIIVFTTNHKDKLDPALLRPGRMDVHINLSYCSGHGFKLLASNYLGLHETCQNPLYDEVHSLIETTQITPAEVAEELMKDDDANVALEGLAGFLKRKRIEENQIKDEGVDDQTVHEAKKSRSNADLSKIAKMLEELQEKE
ncbi:hypothetical protein RIF29_37229 [Crotalaria pallida]|uniref:AAA+ ATPase domain-containing protein n=1 Tax=Crotalaria pallida TaxID=3830 RepID=A0AAN9ECA3_CROPI